jgi:hypothetical protein
MCLVRLELGTADGARLDDWMDQVMLSTMRYGVEYLQVLGPVVGHGSECELGAAVSVAERDEMPGTYSHVMSASSVRVSDGSDR